MWYQSLDSHSKNKTWPSYQGLITYWGRHDSSQLQCKSNDERIMQYGGTKMGEKLFLTENDQEKKIHKEITLYIWSKFGEF